MRNFIAKTIVKLGGWKLEGDMVPSKKCIVLMAPHTSGWDFVFGWAVYVVSGGAPRTMIKKEFFKFPLGGIMRGAGAFAVDRSRGSNVITQIISEMNKVDKFQLMITPEGTRSKNKHWKTGYYKIAKETGVPLYVGYFNFKKKTVFVNQPWELGANAKDDMKKIKEWYSKQDYCARYPDQFTTD